jgi:uncharacterized SAM-binding protein YcdF (DUF218 family)
MTTLPEFLMSAWRSAMTALVLPPVPLLALAAWGAWRARAARRGGRRLVVAAIVGLWFSQCDVTADVLDAWLAPPPALARADVDALGARVRAGAPVAIVCLGGGVVPLAPEYGAPSLEIHAMARLQYAMWLARATGAPLAVTGGGGPGEDRGGLNEGDIAARLAREQGGPAPRWVETTSRSTHENATSVLPMLAHDGIRDVWIVTHGWHMPRALRDFQRVASAMPAPGLVIHAAPMGAGAPRHWPALRWMPSSEGAWRVRSDLRELIGLSVGA